MIQRNIMKAKTFLNDSVTRARDVSLLRMPVSPIQDQPLTERPLTDSRSHKPLPSWMLFAREVLRNPRTMGAACESSSRLAKAIASFVPPLCEDEIIVELGGGTGKVTEALLQRIAPEQLVSVELSSSFADYLQRRFPKARIIRGDALHLQDLLGNNCERVRTIISGLPFLTLPHMQVHGIVKQIEEILQKDNGSFIQFTYNLTGKRIFLPHHFKRVSHKVIWSNLPPARINQYQLERK